MRLFKFIDKWLFPKRKEKKKEEEKVYYFNIDDLCLKGFLKFAKSENFYAQYRRNILQQNRIMRFQERWKKSDIFLFSQEINNAFLWKSTKEGEDFWYKKHLKLENSLINSHLMY